MQIDLSGRNVLVTGASRGIGRAIADTLAEAGARVAIHYHRSQAKAEELANNLGNGSQPFQANLENTSEVLQLFQRVKQEFGQVDGLVNNAGIAISADVEADDEEFIRSWSKTTSVNLLATALLCKKVIEHFQEIGGGRIVNIASRAAFRGDTSDYMAYAASKGGVVALTRSIARAYGKQQIKAFTVAPGFTRTDMAEEFVEKYGEEYVKNDIALPSLTQPSDITPTVVFLLSGMADHATGATIDINAGSYVH